MRYLKILSLLLLVQVGRAQLPLSQQMAATAMNTWKDSFALGGKQAKWSYDMGVILKGVEGIWLNTGDVQYFNYIRTMMDFYIGDDGSIKGYRKDEFNIDHINNGKLCLLLYRVTGKEKYLKAANLLRQQLREHPRTQEGGFWHKKIYTSQMWLDGLYMGEPFYAEYAWLAHEDTAFNDIGNQFIWIEKHTRDSKTGLLYHAWDESKTQKWANAATGTSPNFWARAMGWYGVALVDALDYFPADHPKRKLLLDILNRFVNAIAKVQDAKSGLWYDVLDMPTRKGNYTEASASSMFVFTIAKAVRKGYIPQEKIAIAKKAYAGIVKQFIKTEAGQTNLYGTVQVSGLGGNPYRDGSFEYYMSEPVVVNDPKGVGAFILASNEMEMLPTMTNGKGKTIMMDNYFNRETKKDAFGNTIVFHYKWWEEDNGGFSFVNHIIQKNGAKTTILDAAPTAANLKQADVFFLIDPDWPKENKTPNYIEPQHIAALYEWVKAGGVLVMMANDSNNVEFTRYNQLAAKFGMHFNENMRHDVIDNQFEQGAIPIPAGHPIFKNVKKAFIKQICTQTISKPAVPVYAENGEVLMSMAKVGKGTVFAVGDPWFYNEYVDGRKIPAQFENYKAANDLILWLLKQTKK